MNILITGSTGFVGKNLKKYLANLGHNVRGISRADIGDFKDIKDWTPFLKNIDVVIHTAGRAHRTYKNSNSNDNIYIEENVLITKRIAEASTRTNVNKFIFLSSSKVYGEFSNSPFTELDECFPRDAYAKSKFFAEQEILKISENSNVTFIVLRPPLIYGEGVKANFKSLLMLIDISPILPFASFTGKRSFLCIRNLSHFISKVVTLNNLSNFDILNISDNGTFTLCETVKTIAKWSNRNVYLFPFPCIFINLILTLLGKSDLYYKLNGHFELSTSKIKNDYNWLPAFEFPQGLYDKTTK